MAKRKQRKSTLDAGAVGAGAGAAGPEIRLNAGFSLVLNAAPNGVVPLRIGGLTFPLTREEAISMLFGEESDGSIFAPVNLGKRKITHPRLKRLKHKKRKPTGKVKLATVKTTDGSNAARRNRYREFAKAYRAGESAASIAKRYGVAQQTVYHGLSELKVPKRNPGRGNAAKVATS